MQRWCLIKIRSNGAPPFINLVDLIEIENQNYEWYEEATYRISLPLQRNGDISSGSN